MHKARIIYGFEEYVKRSESNTVGRLMKVLLKRRLEMIKNKSLWIGVLIGLLFIFSQVEMDFLYERVLAEFIHNQENGFIMFFLYALDSTHNAIQEVFQFLLSWKGVATLLIYLAHKNIQESFVAKS